MDSFFTKEDFNQNDIKNIIDEGFEENIYLEFKSGLAIKNDDRSKMNISIDVSSFANSDGGILIYGIDEYNHKAKETSYIDGKRYTKEWLENVIDSIIQRNIPNIKIFPIRFDKNFENTIYLIKIPPSPYAPHMAKDKKYHKRTNFKNVIMEEYEVRHLYNRKELTKLIIDDFLIKGGGSSTRDSFIDRINYSVDFQVKNIGETVEKDFKLEVSVPIEILSLNISFSNPINKYFIRSDQEYKIYSIPNRCPIFQDELTTIGSLNFTIDKNLYENLDNFHIKLKLYYSSGTDNKIIRLKNKLFYNNRKLTINDFN